MKLQLIPIPILQERESLLTLTIISIGTAYIVGLYDSVEEEELVAAFGGLTIATTPTGAQPIPLPLATIIRHFNGTQYLTLEDWQGIHENALRVAGCKFHLHYADTQNLFTLRISPTFSNFKQYLISNDI